VLKEFLPAEILEIRILKPACRQFLIREIEGVFQDRQPRHAPYRQRRLTRLVRISRAEARFEKTPIDGKRQQHQLMAKIDDLVESCLEEVVLTRFAQRPRLHAPLPKCTLEENHASRTWAKPGIDFCRLFKRFHPDSCKSKPRKRR
jgi:hypothetical protein